MKKLFALLLALAMVFSLAACGGNGDTPNSQAPNQQSSAPDPAKSEAPATPTQPTGSFNADDIPDEMTSTDGTYDVAFVTDVGQLKDKSFNQGTYDGVKLYASANGLSYKYYQPANGNEATDDDRYDAMKAAADNGAKVIVAAGFMQEAAIRKAALEYPDIPFIFIDGYPLTEEAGVEGSPILSNVAGISFKEEQSGYLAGYAVVKDGFTKLGFSGGGGGTNAACQRFGYGYVQGANAAAAELGVDVEMNFSWEYGATFSASGELQTMISGWYQTGTEIVFACGGSMFSSITAAAAANDGYVIGVDVDQSFEDPDMIVTSAMKGLADAVQWAVAHVFDGKFDEIGGTGTSLGAADNAVGLPTATWSMETFTVAEYEDLFAKIVSGELKIDDVYDNMAGTDWSNLTLNII